jgi:integrase
VRLREGRLSRRSLQKMVMLLNGIFRRAQALARLDARKRWSGPGDLVFVGWGGEYLNGSALRRRFKRARDSAGLRPLRFHDLPHTFGKLRTDAARRLSAAWGVAPRRTPGS